MLILTDEDIREDIRGFKQRIQTARDKLTAFPKTEVKYKYRFWDKGKALERLGKHLKLYQENANLTLGFDGDTASAWALILKSINRNSDPSVLPDREGDKA